MAKKLIAYIVYPVLIAAIVIGLFSVVQAAREGNIDPDDRWAWSTNGGWINFNPVHGGVTVYADHLEGYAWGENVGWIRMGAHTGGGLHTYGNASAGDYGVNVDGNGNLFGYAWGTSVGWINFAPDHGGVTIDLVGGSLDGYAWGENVGWIHFKHTAVPVYNVVAQPADMSISHSVSPAEAAPGETITYTLIFSNAGAGTATDGIITDIVPVSIASTSVISNGVAITDTGASPPYVWRVQNLAPGEGGVITITAVLSAGLPAGHTFTSTVNIATTALDSDPADNSAVAAVTVNVNVKRRIYLPLVLSGS